MPVLYLLIAVVGYLLGSIPTGYLVARSRGVDIRAHGSGNIGATNVLRVLGKKTGAFVFLCDALKGWLAVFLASRVLPASDPVLAGIIAALACILGHNFPVWLGFRGGKGIATTFGALLALMPLALLVAAIAWFAVFFAFRYVSVASLAAAATLPITTAVLCRFGRATPALIWFSLAAALLAGWMHRSNLRRLANGTEPQFARKGSASPPAPSAS